MRVLSTLVGVSLLAAPAYADDFPREVVDDRQQPFEIAEEPERVVALAAFALDMVVALDREPVGITTYEGRRPAYLGDAVTASTDLGEVAAPNLELLDTLSPDLTIGSLRYHGAYQEEIGRSGDFLAWEPAGVAQSDKIVMEMGAALGAAEEAAQMNADFAALRADYAAATNSEGPSFLFVWNFFDTFYAYQDNLMTAQLLSDLGATNLVGFNTEVQSAEEAVRPLDPEELLALNPDVLFVFSNAEGPIQNNRVFSRLTAVRDGRAYAVGSHWSQPDGPIARELVLREGAALLYPSLFETPDMMEGAAAEPLAFTN